MDKKNTSLIYLVILIFPFVFIGENAASKTTKTTLGNGLTHIGAEKAGNKDGTIPPWTGGITVPPKGYKKGDHHPDPYADDKILFSINIDNLDKYKDKLSTGQIALMKKYPSFKMNVFPTRRSASMPQRIYDATIKNEKTSKLINDGNSISGAIIGTPFPIPENGLEVIWNHILRYRGDSVSFINNQAPVTIKGKYTLIKTEDEWYFTYHEKGATARRKNFKILYFKQIVKTPPNVAGTIYLLHDPLDQISDHRQVWSYLPGQRRVVRVPKFAYDLLVSITDGLRTVDQYDMFTGAIDRYDWKLLGKKELYVPYNSYKLHSDNLKYKEIIKPGHINTDYARYELHRVWVVDATLKKGMRHIYPRRTFYLDEDSWQVLLVDIYDKNGQLWRVSEGHVINYYEVPVLWTTLQAFYDLKSGRYYVSGLDNEERMYDFSIKRSPGDYTPAALRKIGRR